MSSAMVLCIGGISIVLESTNSLAGYTKSTIQRACARVMLLQNYLARER